VTLLVAAAALAAAGAVVGAAVLSGEDAPREEGPRPRAGAPPIALQLGVRTDPEALDLRRAIGLYSRGSRARAGLIFERHDSLEARVGAAFADWPDGSLGRLERLGGLHARSGVVQLHLGLARLWAAQGDAAAAWRRAAEGDPDTPYAVTAGDLLHPEYARGLPVVVPASPAPASVAALPPARQLAVLRRQADGGGTAERLRYGVALQRLGRPRSAERVYAEAARLAPADPQALTAAAVGRFTKDEPARAFSRLGPLARRFPAEPTVRFHLGLLLLWTGAVDEARTQLERARSLRPGSPLAREADRFLTRLERVQKNGTD
jgi:tetratricopeptide (TPR) repeat protein